MKNKKIIPYIMVSPYIIHFIIFVAFPVAFSIVLIFHKWNIISPMEYIGLGNFIRLFNDEFFFKSVLNTLIFLLIHIPLQIIIALTIAEALNRKIKFKGFFRAAYFLPVIVSGVVVTMLWQQVYGYDSGLINRFLINLGFGKVGWLVDPYVAMPSIAIMATW
ncbi:MAG: carbohydrate ABC transporter permease, partial [Ignavibacteria bacterium]